MKKNKVYSAIAALMLTTVAGQAAADTSGTLSFAADVTAGTCVLSDIDSTYTLPPVDVATVTALAGGTLISQVPVDINVSDCPNGVSRANVLINFTHAMEGSPRLDLGDTTASGVLMYLFKDEGQTNAYSSGQTVSFDIVQGSGQKTLYPGISREGNLSVPISAGVFSAPISLTMSYE